MEKYGISADSDNTILNREAEAVVSLQIALKSIGNLSGIEAFTSLTSLDCFINQLTSLDVSSNTALTDLICGSNRLTSLDVSSNTALTRLLCTNSQQLTSLNIANGNNTSLLLNASGNPNLTCIQVDDASNIPSPSRWLKDATAVYSEDCNTLLSNQDFKLSGISISPNPTSGILNITATKKAAYRLLNISGQVLKKGTLATGEGKIDISSFAKGIYLLNIKTTKFHVDFATVSIVWLSRMVSNPCKRK